MPRLLAAKWLVVVASFSRLVFGTEYYVSLDGNDNASGTREAPFRTLAQAAALMGAGDSCRIQGGRYEEPLIPRSSGNAQAPIHFLGDGPNVIICPAETTTEAGDPLAVDLTTRAHIVISNITFEGVVKISGRGCSVVQCLVRADPQSRAAWAPRRPAISVGGADHHLEHCTVEDWPGIGIELQTNSVRVRVTSCLLDGCGWASPLQPALLARGAAHVLERNTIANSRGTALQCDELWNARIQLNDIHHSGRESAEGASLILRGNGKGTMIRRNWIHDGHGAAWDAVALENEAMNWVFHRNIVWNHGGAAVRFLGSAQSCLVFNNSFWNNGAGLVVSLPASSLPLRAVQVFNNIFAKSGTVPAELSTGRHNFIGDQPGWHNPDALDFRLEEDSPCRNAGESPPDMDDPFATDLGAMSSDEDDWLAGCQREGAPPLLPP